ncbi:autotransporter outer membrane beta-barrel domain-containing protein [Salmonella enterica subsp. enterica serovar Hvittingfoss]|nr:autotransporter outer membrane beta-barrel domain-containing protein [Salmonella enterica subsp. enterica serovar Hvittingfoss]
MAVENKFKLNVIAASVLMGLSLSAVAAPSVATEGKTTGGEVTAPAKTSNLAENVGTVKPEDISVTVNSSTMKLDAALSAVDGAAGSKPAEDSSAKKSYTDALETYGKLKPEEVQKITDLNSKKSAFDSASADFKVFDDKSKAVKDVYDSKLKDLYGSAGDVANHAWIIAEGAGATGSDATITQNADKNTVFNDFVSSVKATKDAVLVLDAQALTSAGGGAASDAAKKADAALKAYANYLEKSYQIVQEQQKQAAAENYIQEKLPGFLRLVEQYKKADGNTDSDKVKNGSKLDGKYATYIQAVKDYRDAKEADKLVKKTAVYTALNDLVTTAGTAAISDSDKAKVSDFAKSLGAAHTIWNTEAGKLSSLQSELDNAKDLSGSKSSLPDGIALTITDNKAAFAGVDKYLKVLIAEAEAKGVDKEGLASAIAKAKEANKVFTENQGKYTVALAELNAAGSERLALIPEWKTLNDTWTEAADALNAAKTAYVGSAAESAVTALEEKKNAYIKVLGDTSAGIKAAIDKAASTYADAVNKGSGTAKTQQEKNAALYTLIGQQKALIPAKLQMDKELLELKSENVAGLQSQLSSAEKVRDDAAKSYNAAVQEYLAAKETFGKTNAVADEVAVSVAEQKLLNLSGATKVSELYFVSGKEKGGFKAFDELKTSAPAWKALTAAGEALSTSTGTDIQTARKNVAASLHSLASLMPLSTADEQKTLRQNYLDALKTISTPATDSDAQSKVANAESITHYLGGLSADKADKADEIAQYDPASGSYKSVIVNVDKDGNVTGVKDNFTGKDLYTGSQDKPFTTTVLDIRALELGNGSLADTNTITVGEAGTKDKKATPVDVWAKTVGKADVSKPAVKLSGNLRTATAQLDADGNPITGEVVRGADQIHLQNVNIHNNFTLADKVQMLKNDVAALNQQAADKIALGQPADGDSGVNTWLKTQTGLLNSKYDNLKLTGLEIATATVNPSFELAGDNAGKFVNNPATVAPDAANILLDNLNITLQNDSVGGISTAIDLSGTGNHILANGGVFDAGQVTDGEAWVLNLSQGHNLVDFDGSVLKGDIKSTGEGNVVTLIKGSLTGNAEAGSGDNLRLVLNGSTWTGASGPNSPDVVLKNNSVWNVKGYHFNVDTSDFPVSSVRSLTLNGNNSLNLVHADGMAQLGGHGFAGAKYATTLNVDTDLSSDGTGVTSILAGTYSPGNLHSLTNTGLAEGYQFGTLDVDGLARGGQYRLSVESAGAEPYTVGGRLADRADATSAHDFVSYKTSESRVVTGKDGQAVTQTVTSDADFTSLSAPAELGVYQYAAEKVIDAVNNRTNIYYRSTGQLSNSAATVVSLAAAPVDVANLESDTLAKHMNSVRHGKDSGVWVSYFGGENRNTTASGPEYKLNTSGVMLGVDTLTENNWLAGVAVSSARSDMSVMNSSGDLNSYGAQFYMSRRYDSGVFVDSALQFNHFSNTAKARMTDGQQAKADFSGNSYGLEAKVGYAWNSEGFFAEPYVRAAARAFDGEHYALSNGMTVNSNDYKSMLGEVGADLGYQYAISGGYVKPYLHLAALNEFADGNSVRVNNVSLDDSVKGAAFQAGLGAEVKVTDNLGGYAAFDYTKGDNTERPWQATVGVNYTW